MVKNQPNCLQKEALTSEIEAVWVILASLVTQNRGFRFHRSGPTNKIKIGPCIGFALSTVATFELILGIVDIYGLVLEECA